VFHHQVLLYTVESEAGKTRLKMKGLVRQGKDPAHSEKLERRETCDKLSGGSLASHFVHSSAFARHVAEATLNGGGTRAPGFCMSLAS
jgi:hypothetical protein